MINTAMRLALLVNFLALTAAFTTLPAQTQRPNTNLQSTIGWEQGGGVTSNLISNLAEVALKLRLRDQTGVKCDVSASSSDLLLKGRVGPVTVRGRGWQSQLGLTCRAIEATVDTCELDVGRVLSNRKLRLTTPAQGNAMIALNSVDFANFITHPRMKPPALANGNSKAIEFLKDGATIDAKTGTVTFFGTYLDEKWKLSLTRGDEQQKAAVTVSPQGNSIDAEDLESVSAELTSAISRFFNELVFELDGTFLKFNDMMITAKGASPSVMLQLQITVHKFPAQGAAF